MLRYEQTLLSTTKLGCDYQRKTELLKIKQTHRCFSRANGRHLSAFTKTWETIPLLLCDSILIRLPAVIRTIAYLLYRDVVSTSDSYKFSFHWMVHADVHLSSSPTHEAWITCEGEGRAWMRETCGARGNLLKSAHWVKDSNGIINIFIILMANNHSIF